MAKKWEKPMLIVLARRNPGEAVLAGCKIAIFGGGPDTFVGLCDQIATVQGGCDMVPGVSCGMGECSTISSS